jgi:hypothetical protein
VTRPFDFAAESSDLDAESSDFVAEAERARLQGDAHSAVKIAEAGLSRSPLSAQGRMALALALIDMGDLRRAREELARALAREIEAATQAPQPEFREALADDELESAFAEAESNPDEMMSANRVVEQTISGPPFEKPDGDFDVANHPTYATETMASLLAEQGRAAEAGALRESLSSPHEAAPEAPAAAASIPAVPAALAMSHEASGSPGGAAWPADREAAAFAERSGQFDAAIGRDHAKQLQLVATLESWLHNIHQNARRNSARGARARAAQASASRGVA